MFKKMINPSTRAQQQRNERMLTLGMVLVFGMLASPAVMAAAVGGGNPIQDMLDGVLDLLNSGVVRSIAVLAVIGFGVAAYFGKISWDWAGRLIIGITCTFGAAGLVDFFSASV